MTKVVKVKFKSSRTYGGAETREYAYLTDDVTIAVGDYCVVQVNSSSADNDMGGFKTVRVTSVDETAESVAKATKWIVQKLDLSGHEAREAARERKKLILIKLAKLAEEQDELLRYAALAAQDDEAKALLDELKGL